MGLGELEQVDQLSVFAVGFRYDDLYAPLDRGWAILEQIEGNQPVRRPVAEDPLSLSETDFHAWLVWGGALDHARRQEP